PCRPAHGGRWIVSRGTPPDGLVTKRLRAFHQPVAVRQRHGPIAQIVPPVLHREREKQTSVTINLTAYEGFFLKRSMYTNGTSCIANQLKEGIGSKLTNKPRETGLTAVLDQGLGLRAMHDLVELSGPYIDVVKFGWGTSVLYPPKMLMDKIALVQAAGIA